MGEQVVDKDMFIDFNVDAAKDWIFWWTANKDKGIKLDNLGQNMYNICMAYVFLASTIDEKHKLVKADAVKAAERLAKRKEEAEKDE